MNTNSQEKFNKIFEEGSKTYYNSSRFFPKNIRDDVFVLYAFVRVADNFVDKTPQDVDGFRKFKNDFENSYYNDVKSIDVIDEFVELSKRKNFKSEWIYGFLESMEMDIHTKDYPSKKEVEKYIYGSAEVIGLMMARIMNLPIESYKAAKYLGKAFQYINFLRDINEDISLGRVYLPRDEMRKFKLNKIDHEAVKKNEEHFISFIKSQINLYRTWQNEAELGYKFIPRNYLIPIKTAADMYKWTANVIDKNPMVVFEKKVKPSKFRIIRQGIINFFTVF